MIVLNLQKHGVMTEKGKTMKFRIHYNGEYEDSIVITGNTIEEIREKAFAEGDKRGWNREDCWSEQID